MSEVVLNKIIVSTRTLEYYSWQCQGCHRSLGSFNRRTLEHNILEHQARHKRDVDLAPIREIQKRMKRLKRQIYQSPGRRGVGLQGLQALRTLAPSRGPSIELSDGEVDP